MHSSGTVPTVSDRGTPYDFFGCSQTCLLWNLVLWVRISTVDIFNRIFIQHNNKSINVNSRYFLMIRVYVLSQIMLINNTYYNKS